MKSEGRNILNIMITVTINTYSQDLLLIICQSELVVMTAQRQAMCGELVGNCGGKNAVRLSAKHF